LNSDWANKWNERYSEAEYAYGELPNEYLKLQLEKLNGGNILFAAEGEGRNAVYAARLGWAVSAFDISEQGKTKALALAKKHNATLDYRVGNLKDLKFVPNQFDAIALIYAHFPAEIKSQINRDLSVLLRKNGIIIFEAFSKNHLAYNSKNEAVGGPKEANLLFSEDELISDFPDYEILELREQEINLNEGKYHNGKGMVMRFLARKK
jgi:2-polyprenyl-3-methyl-5-hydroxy-6-metoxy-1,4-benzoquinol methylase